MDYLLNKKNCDFKTAILNGEKSFEYKDETPKSYEKYNQFISGMEFVKAVRTISTSESLIIKQGDKISLENGLKLSVASVTLKENARRNMYQSDGATRYIINLE